MNIKAALIGVVAFFCLTTLYADELWFLPERFASVTLVTTKGKERVTVETWTKAEGSEHKIFESRLIPTEGGAYRTPKGTVFRLKHLIESIINDGNRHINSGDWQLTISGAGAEFGYLKRTMPQVAFGKTPPLVYLGAKKEAK